MKLDNIIVASDSQIAIFYIIDKIVTPKHISVLVDAIKCIVKNIKYITFSYYNKTINTLADKITRKTHATQL